jgi:hypothetical protein
MAARGCLLICYDGKAFIFMIIQLIVRLNLTKSAQFVLTGCRALSGVYIDFQYSLTKLRFATHPKTANGAGRLTVGPI